MKLSAELRAFEGRLGHAFADPRLLVQAVTHGSMGGATRDDNQRLEFLGDRVLGLVMAEALLAAAPGATEGQIAPRFNRLVRREACAEVARGIDLGAVLRLGRSEMQSGGRRKDALLADAMEAVIAAVYRDAGFDAAAAVVRRLWAPLLAGVDEDARDAKSALQEWAQARGQEPPAYNELARKGPDHAPSFVVRVTLQSGETAEGTARSKRQAEQEAAALLLSRLA